MAKFVNPNNSNRGGDEKYKAVIASIQKDGVCPFCPAALTKYHKKPIIKEGKYWILTDNMYPYKGAKQHLLVVHKTHIEDMRMLSDGAWKELFDLVAEETKKRKLGGGTFLMRFGETTYTGASVAHLHVNVISPDVDDPSRAPIMARVG
jgi:ATP adenylyltransferase